VGGSYKLFFDKTMAGLRERNKQIYRKICGFISKDFSIDPFFKQLSYVY